MVGKSLFFNLFMMFPFGLSQVLPSDFAWGTATSAFQVEGAWNVSNRGLSIWDYFQSFPGRIYNNDTGQIADEFYYRYQSDIDLMANLNIKAFRLSFSWTRIFPTGNISEVNQKGVDFYLALIQTLIQSNIEPYVTLYHWDLPQTYNDLGDHSGWLNPNIVHQFNAYSDFCFKTFGHLVKKWITMNEIQTFAWVAYGLGIHAPGRCSPEFGSWCSEVGGGGNSSTEPYIVAHHALLAHGLSVQTYRTKYKYQKGKIGLAINCQYEVPWNSSNINDINAVNTALSFEYGWLADPVVFGQYPAEMRNLITGNRLPEFNSSSSALLKGSFDFLGLNYYGSFYLKYTGIVGSNYGDDGRYQILGVNATGHQIGPQAEASWLYVYPKGLRQMLNWINKRYNSPEIYIFENGVSCPNESTIQFPQVLNDTFRVNYVYNHVMNMLDSIVEDKIKVKGYFLWSLVDNFEWSDGYNVRFGITYVDYQNNLTRTLKESAYLYQSLISYLGVNPYNSGIFPSANSLIGKVKSFYT